MSLINARNIMVKSLDSGEVDYDDLYEAVRVNRDAPAIVVTNIGTTMKGAVDDVHRVRDILDDLAVSRRYIHADAALSGMILPFVDDPQTHNFDSGIDSMAVSGHKMIGSPVPCGIALTKREYVARVSRSVEYVGVLDTTLTGSRSALAPLIIWYALQKHGLGRLQEDRGQMPGDRGVRGDAVQRQRHTRLAQQELRDGGVPAPLRGGRPQVVDRPLRGHSPSHRDAERQPRADRHGR